MFYDNSVSETIYQINSRSYANWVYEVKSRSGTVKIFCDTKEECEKIKELNHNSADFLNNVLLNKKFKYYDRKNKHRIYEIEIKDKSNNILNNYLLTSFTVSYITLSYEHEDERIVIKAINMWIDGVKKKTLLRNFRNISDIIKDRNDEKIPLSYDEALNLIKTYFMPLYEKFRFE